MSLLLVIVCKHLLSYTGRPFSDWVFLESFASAIHYSSFVVADWLLKLHSGLLLIPNRVFINSERKADKLWMLFFDCEDPCLPAYVVICPKSSPTRNWVRLYKHTEIWVWGKLWECDGAQRVEDVFQGIEPAIYILDGT